MRVNTEFRGLDIRKYLEYLNLVAAKLVEEVQHMIAIR